MSRALTAGMQSAIAAAVVRPVILFEGVFSGGTLRLWSGIGDLSWNSQTWTGAGNLLRIAPVDENSEIRAAQFSVGLNGLSSSILATVLAQIRTGLNGKIWLGAMSSNDNTSLIADPFLAFHGKMDSGEITDSGETCTISVTIESRLIDLDKTRERRYTHDDQQIDYAGDQGFKMVPALQDLNIEWGTRPIPG